MVEAEGGLNKSLEVIFPYHKIIIMVNENLRKKNAYLLFVSFM